MVNPPTLNPTIMGSCYKTTLSLSRDPFLPHHRFPYYPVIDVDCRICNLIYCQKVTIQGGHPQYNLCYPCAHNLLRTHPDPCNDPSSTGPSRRKKLPVIDISSRRLKYTTCTSSNIYVAILCDDRDMDNMVSMNSALPLLVMNSTLKKNMMLILSLDATMKSRYWICDEETPEAVEERGQL